MTNPIFDKLFENVISMKEFSDQIRTAVALIPNVKLLGFVSGDALTELVGNAKVLLLPSVCYENCPLSILEAHAMGVPVVTMNSGGMAELVRDGVTGTLVRTPTPEGIAEKLYETLKDEAYYSVLRENSKNEKRAITR